MQIFQYGEVQNVLDKELQAVRIARNKQTMSELFKLLEDFPRFQHRGTGICSNAVDSVGTAIAKLHKVVFNPVCDIGSRHPLSADIFGAPMECARGCTDGNIDDSSVVNVSAFIYDNIEQLRFLNSRVYLLFDVRIEFIEE